MNDELGGQSRKSFPTTGIKEKKNTNTKLTFEKFAKLNGHNLKFLRAHSGLCNGTIKIKIAKGSIISFIVNSLLVNIVLVRPALWKNCKALQ